MVLPQRVTAEESFPFVPSALAAAAAAYQSARAMESEQHALMAQQSHDDEWSDEVRAMVLVARDRICVARQSRTELRERLREFVIALRDAGESPSSAIDHTRSMIHLLESTNVITSDDGRLKVEVLAWAAEDFGAP
jgi:hypothetical protein